MNHARPMAARLKNSIIQQENYNDLFQANVVDELIFVKSRINSNVNLPRDWAVGRDTVMGSCGPHSSAC